jgi:archaemetzincin
MSSIHLLAIGEVAGATLQALRTGIAQSYRAPCDVLPGRLDPAFAHHAERQQHHSTEILARLADFVTPGTWRLLGVADVDLYIPILTFVFGEAQLDGACAVVSMRRLRQEFYGLPSDPKLADARLLKEAVHELGHTLGLTHCDDYRCAMAASHAVEWIDLKGKDLCPACRALCGSPAAG